MVYTISIYHCLLLAQRAMEGQDTERVDRTLDSFLARGAPLLQRRKKRQQPGARRSRMGGAEDIDMGTFRTRCQIEHPAHRTKRVAVPSILVDTGSEYTWVPAKMLERLAITREKKDVRFVMANGQEITRSVGFAIIRLGKFFTIDEVVFGEPGDLALLGLVPSRA